jgi:selenocysteine lyase/cysteine desulfurase
MANAALTQILEWGVENIQETLSQLTKQISLKAKEYAFDAPDDTNRVGHMIGLKIPENKIPGIARNLAGNRIYISFRGTNMRIAPHLYNDSRDVDKLFQLL